MPDSKGLTWICVNGLIIELMQFFYYYHANTTTIYGISIAYVINDMTYLFFTYKTKKWFTTPIAMKSLNWY